MREADTKTDVGLRGTCAYYQCFGTVCAMFMCAAGFWACERAIALLHSFLGKRTRFPVLELFQRVF